MYDLKTAIYIYIPGKHYGQSFDPKTPPTFPTRQPAGTAPRVAAGLVTEPMWSFAKAKPLLLATFGLCPLAPEAQLVSGC